EKGKLTARERIDLLVDPGSFVEIGAFVTHRATGFGLETKKQLGDGVITGYGKINGRTVFIASQDFTFMGGSLGEAHAEKIVRVLDLAIKSGSPMIFLNDSGGARIQEGVDSLKGYGDIFYLNVKASGFIPQIAAILGPAAGGAVYSPALMDFIIMSRKNSYMFVTGPKVVKAAIGEEVDEYSLGGAEIHEQKSGVASLVGETEEEALNLIKKLLSYLPSNNREDPPYVKSEDPVERADKELDSIIPTDPNAPYDVKEVITRVLDKDTFFEIQPNWAQNAVIGFGRIGGRVVGIIANQPMYLAGSLDIDSSDKISRFIRFLDAFNISIITFVDVPGFLPGTVQEYGGVIRHGAKVIYAYSEATSPKITVIMRKAYGGAYIAMGSKHLGADYVLAYPFAEIAVMGPRGAVEILYGKELASLKD
ncbi:MAG: acyl-CoA carboxylase subunit beta, partial [Fervidicoccus fontis]